MRSMTTTRPLVPRLVRGTAAGTAATFFALAGLPAASAWMDAGGVRVGGRRPGAATRPVDRRPPVARHIRDRGRSAACNAPDRSRCATGPAGRPGRPRAARAAGPPERARPAARHGQSNRESFVSFLKDTNDRESTVPCGGAGQRARCSTGTATFPVHRRSLQARVAARSAQRTAVAARSAQGGAVAATGAHPRPLRGPPVRHP